LLQYALNQQKKKRKLTVSEDLFQDIQTFAPSILEHLKTLLPPNMSFLTQYLIAVSCDDPEKLLQQYGISQTKKNSLIIRMSESIQEGLLIKERLTADNGHLMEIRKFIQRNCIQNKLFCNTRKNNRTKMSLKIANPRVYTDVIGFYYYIF